MPKREEENGIVRCLVQSQKTENELKTKIGKKNKGGGQKTDK